MIKKNVSLGFEPFVAGLKTGSDLAILLDDIQAVRKLLYEMGPDLDAAIKSGTSGLFGQGFENLKKQNKVPGEVGDFEKFLTGLEQVCKALPKVRVTLAFEPSGEFTSELSDWFGAACGGKGLLEVNVRPQILAGLQLEYNGKYKDFSYGAKLGEVLEKKYLVSSI